MAFLDNFNAWYDKAIPDETAFVSWVEPAQGSRYRWKQKPWKKILMIFVILLIGIVPWPDKHGRPPLPSSERIAVALVLVSLLLFLSWALSFTKTRIYLSKHRIVAGQGRGAPKLRIDDDSVTMRMERMDEYHTLVFLKEGQEELRIFLDPKNENEVFAFVAALDPAIKGPSVL